MDNRVTFLVDGFNLYHSVKQAMDDLEEPNLRWLDLRGLLESYLSIFGTEADLEEIHYYTAYAHHLTGRKPDVVNRHRKYVTALEETGIITHIARFKRKDIWCHHCKKNIERYEEKETDVAIALSVLELLQEDACDTLVIVSGDTDLAPAVRTAKRLWASKQVCVAFPHGRFNAELQQIADFHYRVRGKQYAKYQFPDPLELPSGKTLTKPPKW